MRGKFKFCFLELSGIFFFICSWLNPWMQNPQIQGPNIFLLMPGPSRHFGHTPPSLANEEAHRKPGNMEGKVSWEGCKGGHWGAGEQAFMHRSKNVHTAYLWWRAVLLL